MPKWFNQLPALQRKNTWMVWIGIFLLAAAGGAWYFLGGAGSAVKSASAQSTPSYHTAAVQRGSFRVSIAGTGSLAASQSVDMGFPTQGPLVKLNVKLGDVVKSGQQLAQLGNIETLQAAAASAQLAYLQAQKDLQDLQDSANVNLAQSYQDWVTAKATYEDALKVNQRMPYSRCSQETNTKYAAQVDKAREKLAPLPYGTDEWIEAKNVYDIALANYNYCIAHTPQEKINAQAALDVADAALKKADQAYQAVKAGSGIAVDDLNLAEARLEEARARLEQANRNLQGAQLIAPIDGTITYLAADEGAIVGTSTFLTIADLNHPAVEVQVDESDLNLFTLGSPAEIVFDALPEQTFHGKLVQVDPQLVNTGQVKTAKGLIELDEASASALQKMPLGLGASVDIISKDVKDSLIVPVEALRDLGDGQYGVFVLQDNKLRMQVVQVGAMDTTHAEILEGLSEGQMVSTGMVQTSNQ